MPNAQIPADLRTRAQWVCWRTEDRDGTPTKVPVEPTTGGCAAVDDAATWSDYATAQAYCRAHAEVAGVGFVFTRDDPYAGVDLDDCRDPATGAVADWAAEIVRELASYTEASPSGTGLHVYVRATVPDGGNRRGDLELYDRDRYFTVTGDRIPGAPRTVEERGDALAAIHADYIAPADAERDIDPVAPADSGALADDALLEKAMAAANGDKFERLWHGDTAGYDSHSEADLALCTLLAFWTGGDPQRIDDLFAQSGLVRAKWRTRPDYRERTIHTAIQSCSAFYEPDEE